MKIKYGGGNQIDANTLINSLIHFTTVVQEINKNLSAELHTEKKIEIKINALAPGSFEVFTNFIATSIGAGIMGLFSKDVIGYTANLVQTVGGVYKLAKFLGGDKPKSVETKGDTKVIQNFNGQTNIFDLRGANIYLDNPLIQTAIAKEFETLQADENVSNFDLLDKDETPLFVSDREDFIKISKSEPSELENNERILPDNKAMLRIVRLSFDPKMKSDFLYLGNHVNALVTDADFYKNIDKGEAIRKGDVLESILEIKQRFDESLNAWVNTKTYKVVTVIKHHPRSEQGNLD